MTAVAVAITSTVIVAPSAANKFIDLHNAGAATIYLCYDGPTATVADGFPLLSGARLQLDGTARCSKGVVGIVVSGTVDCRVQVG